MANNGARTIGIRAYAAMAYSGHCDLESHMIMVRMAVVSGLEE